MQSSHTLYIYLIWRLLVSSSDTSILYTCRYFQVLALNEHMEHPISFCHAGYLCHSSILIGLLVSFSCILIRLIYCSMLFILFISPMYGCRLHILSLDSKTAGSSGMLCSKFLYLHCCFFFFSLQVSIPRIWQ